MALLELVGPEGSAYVQNVAEARMEDGFIFFRLNNTAAEGAVALDPHFYGWTVFYAYDTVDAYLGEHEPEEEPADPKPTLKLVH